MPREIKSLNAVPLNLPSNQINDFKDRLVKLIPSEIVTAYITIPYLSLYYTKANISGTLRNELIILDRAQISPKIIQGTRQTSGQ